MSMLNMLNSFNESELRSLGDLGLEPSDRKLDAIILLGGSLIFGMVGALLSMPFEKVSWFSTGISGLIIWLSIYTAVGWTEVPAMKAWVVEQFGKPKRILNPGLNILCFPGFIDKVREKVDLEKRRVKLFQGNEIDFDCGNTAPIEGYAWFQTQDVLLWTYRVINNPESWIQDQVDDYIRPILEGLSLDDARKQKQAVANKYKNGDIKIEGKSLHDFARSQIGIDWTSLLIPDITIPQDVQEIRMERARGEADKDRRVNEAIGYEKALQAIIDAAKKNSYTMTREEAKSIYDKNKDREAFTASGANVSIIGTSVAEAIGSLFGERK